MTGTVESIPLIASSIMSKKIAEGTAALVLDVKVGSGAFMREEPQARRLAADHGDPRRGARGAPPRRCSPGWTRRSGAPWATRVEVAEAVAALRGDGPPDLVEVTLALAREMLRLAGIDADPAAALADGRAMDTLPGDGRAPRAATPTPRCPRPGTEAVLPRRQAGWLRRLDARAVGVAAWRLGAGRAVKEDPVSPAAGVHLPGQAGGAGRAGPAAAGAA